MASYTRAKRRRGADYKIRIGAQGVSRGAGGVLGAFTVFDWISPVLQLSQNLGGMTTIDATVEGKTGREVAEALRRAGVSTGTGMTVNGRILLPVSDPDRARRVLSKL